ncbi:MAG: hypothetical protein LBI39_04530 [Puniceicoccales bacterium]|jgi:hypothetical protein|nr:hypothetical protein [Puniceicoccales bacterium]
MVNAPNIHYGFQRKIDGLVYGQRSGKGRLALDGSGRLILHAKGEGGTLFSRIVNERQRMAYAEERLAAQEFHKSLSPGEKFGYNFRTIQCTVENGAARFHGGLFCFSPTIEGGGIRNALLSLRQTAIKFDKAVSESTKGDVTADSLCDMVRTIFGAEIRPDAARLADDDIWSRMADEKSIIERSKDAIPKIYDALNKIGRKDASAICIFTALTLLLNFSIAHRDGAVVETDHEAVTECKKLGRGSTNTVCSITYDSTSGKSETVAFKESGAYGALRKYGTLVAAGTGVANALARTARNLDVHGMTTNANVATRNVSDLLMKNGLGGDKGASVQARAVVVDGRAGLAMTVADGTSLRKVPLHSDLWESAAFRRQQTNIQLQDFIVGNVDAHNGNVFSGGQTIDGDRNFPIGFAGVFPTTTINDLAVKAKLGYGYIAFCLPKVIDEEQRDAILATNEKDLRLALRKAHLLDSQIDEAIDRLVFLRRAIAEGKVHVIEKNDWSNSALLRELGCNPGNSYFQLRLALNVSSDEIDKGKAARPGLLGVIDNVKKDLWYEPAKPTQ